MNYYIFLIWFIANVDSRKLINRITRKLGIGIANSLIRDYSHEIYLNSTYIKNDNLLKEKYKNKKLLTISPGGLKGFYTLGVCTYIKENYDVSDWIYSGASSGAWNALFMCKKNNNSDFLKTIHDIDYESFSDINDVEQILKYEIMKNYKTEDFNLDKLFVTVTIFNKVKITTNIYSEFDSLQDAIDCCIASSHIPFITGKIFHKYKKNFAFDGGFGIYPYIKLLTPMLNITPNIWDDNDTDNFLDLDNLNIRKNNINSILFTLFEKGYNDSFLNKKIIDDYVLNK